MSLTSPLHERVAYRDRESPRVPKPAGARKLFIPVAPEQPSVADFDSPSNQWSRQCSCSDPAPCRSQAARGHSHPYEQSPSSNSRATLATTISRRSSNASQYADLCSASATVSPETTPPFSSSLTPAHRGAPSLDSFQLPRNSSVLLSSTGSGLPHYSSFPATAPSHHNQDFSGASLRVRESPVAVHRLDSVGQAAFYTCEPPSHPRSGLSSTPARPASPSASRSRRGSGVVQPHTLPPLNGAHPATFMSVEPQQAPPSLLSASSQLPHVGSHCAPRAIVPPSHQSAALYGTAACPPSPVSSVNSSQPGAPEPVNSPQSPRAPTRRLKARTDALTRNANGFLAAQAASGWCASPPAYGPIYQSEDSCRSSPIQPSSRRVDPVASSSRVPAHYQVMSPSARDGAAMRGFKASESLRAADTLSASTRQSSPSSSPPLYATATVVTLRSPPSGDRKGRSPVLRGGDACAVRPSPSPSSGSPSLPFEDSSQSGDQSMSVGQWSELLSNYRSVRKTAGDFD